MESIGIRMLVFMCTHASSVLGIRETLYMCVCVCVFDFQASSQVRSQLISQVHDVFVYNRTMYLTIPSSDTSTQTNGKVVLLDVSHITWSEDNTLEVTALFTAANPKGVCTFRNIPGNPPAPPSPSVGSVLKCV